MSGLGRFVPSRAMVVAIVALVVAVGGQSAYAVAANFLLNTSNTSTAQTVLNGSAVSGKAALQVTNTSAGAGGTALGLSVASGHAPFTVSSGAGKVANLNADLLDGKDSTAFTSGTGGNNWGGATIAHGTSAVFAGIGGARGYQVSATCQASLSPRSWTIANTGTTTFDLYSTVTGVADIHKLTAGSSVALLEASVGPQSVTFQLFWPGSKLITIITSSSQSNAGCEFVTHVITAGS